MKNETTETNDKICGDLLALILVGKSEGMGIRMGLVGGYLYCLRSRVSEERYNLIWDWVVTQYGVEHAEGQPPTITDKDREFFDKLGMKLNDKKGDP